MPNGCYICSNTSHVSNWCPFLAENNIYVLVTEKEEAQFSKVATKLELHKVREEVSQVYKTIKSLEDAMYQLKTNVFHLPQENEKALDSKTVLE